MSEPTTATIPVLEQLVLPADACEGDACLLPAHGEQHIVNRRLDLDAV